jgi:ACS family hexuronate transporter-like MFS transporter
MDQLQTTKFGVSNMRWFIVIINALLLGLNYGDRAAIGVGAPYIIKEFHFDNITWGIILSAFSFGYAPFCFVGGWTSDKFGPRKIMALACIWWSALTALTVVGFNFTTFFLQRLLFGFGEGPQGSVTTKTLGNWFPQRELGSAIAIANASTALGGAIATPFIVWLMVMTNGNWRIPFIVLGILGVLCAIGWSVIVRDKPEQHPWITAKELAHIQSGDLARTQEFADDGSVPTVRQYLKSPLVWTIAIAFFGYSWVLFTFLSWFPTYLVQARHIDIKSLAISGSIPWLAGALGIVVGGLLTDWLGRKTGNTTRVRKNVIVVCLLGAGIAFAPSALATTVNSAVALMAVSCFLLYMTGAQYFAIIAEVVPTSRVGGVMGFVHFFANCAGIFAPSVVGAFVGLSHSWSAGFIIGAALAVIGALGLAIFGKTEKKSISVNSGITTSK